MTIFIEAREPLSHAQAMAVVAAMDRFEGRLAAALVSPTGRLLAIETDFPERFGEMLDRAGVSWKGSI